MKKYMVTIMTIYGSLTVDDVYADSYDEATKEADRLAQDALDTSKTDEVHEY
jgi:CHASE3 domain sensor protein